MFNELGEGILAACAYGAVGLLVIALGYAVTDLMTPGKLSKLIYEESNWNAAIVAATHLIAVGTIVVTAIWTSRNDYVQGLVDSAAYGVLGIAILAASYVIIDKLTPGDLGEALTHTTPRAAVLVTAAAHLTVGALVSAAIA
jgi:uncharacterized membrane protein YjfL (UPF0719 family)